MKTFAFYDQTGALLYWVNSDTATIDQCKPTAAMAVMEIPAQSYSDIQGYISAKTGLVPVPVPPPQDPVAPVDQQALAAKIARVNTAQVS